MSEIVLLLIVALAVSFAVVGVVFAIGVICEQAGFVFY